MMEGAGVKICRTVLSLNAVVHMDKVAQFGHSILQPRIGLGYVNHCVPEWQQSFLLQVGTPALRNLDPFLMLDELKGPAHEAASGFPDHPHRGFSTCSIILRCKPAHAHSLGEHQLQQVVPCSAQLCLPALVLRKLFAKLPKYVISNSR